MTRAAWPPTQRRTARQWLAAALTSLSTRVMAASALLAIMIAGIFTVLAFAVRDLSDAAGRQARAKDVVADTMGLQKLVIDLETGVRGFVITGDESFLRPFKEAEQALRGPDGSLARFRREAGSDPATRRSAVRLTGLIEGYIVEYLEPLVEIARDSPAAARGETADQEGQLRSNELRDRFDRFLDLQREQAAATADSARAQARRAIALGFGGVAASVAMILLLGVYLTRSITRPVRQIASEARRIARGDLAVDMDERGPGEIGKLKRAFGAMAADLAEWRRAMEDQNARLRESERLKSELVSIVSHEIRTPLASILGFTSVLLQREVDRDDQKRFLEIIGVEARRLTSLLDDFLDVQRLEEAPVDVKHGEVDVSALLRTQMALFSAESEKHRLDLRLPDEPLLVQGDAGRLAQVFSNLISNAIKYSPDGGPVEVEGEQQDGVVRINVRDAGFGIPEDVRDRIFTKFFRGAAAASGIAGSGLGLALARSVVEAHGGSIAFESTVGEGTTFSVELPVEPREAATGMGEGRH